MANPRDASRPLRADARRNRVRVLEAAVAAFAESGLSVPVHEIARRAGVGTGTVSRHFPTKEALFDAIVQDRIERLVDHARGLAEAEEPGAALFDFLSAVVEAGAVNRGLADALAGAGFDVEAAVSGAEDGLLGALRALLGRAQAAGAVRRDVEPSDVKALVVGCLARERHAVDAGARERLMSVVRAGLRAPSASPRYSPREGGTGGRR